MALSGLECRLAKPRVAQLFFTILAQINLLLMVFNLLPIGPLDGHYIAPHFAASKLARLYRYL